MKKITTLLQRRWSLAIPTLALALLSGHWMQSGSQLIPPATPQTLPDAPVGSAALLPTPSFPDRVVETRSPRTAGCAPKMEVSQRPDATLRVSLNAPCHKDTDLRLTVAGLSADDRTDAAGHWEVRLPLLEPHVTLALEFGDYRLSHSLSPDTPSTFQHVVLTWHGAQVFRINAESHLSEAMDGKMGGTLTKAGNGSGDVFEIYSFPTGSGTAQGVVRLSVDAEVTAANCGTTVSTTAYQTGFLAGLRKTQISYTMPECERVGDVVRLQNLFRDMRLAAR